MPNHRSPTVPEVTAPPADDHRTPSNSTGADHHAQVDRFEAEVERFASVVALGHLDAPVAACPGWDIRKLVGHLGTVHRWAHQAAATGHQPERARPTVPEGDAPALAAWIRDGAATLATTLRGLDPDAPTWHPFTVAQVAGLWPRRQAQETLVHRWDAEHAAGMVTPIDPPFAADGIDEYFEVILPRVVVREQVELPTSTLHVHCTDTPGEWLVRAVDGQVELTRAHAKGDAALRGPAESLLLRLWGRPVAPDAVDVVGDADAAADWLALGGA